ncbi:coiled-coil domain-containing protein 91 isoform X2 [Hemicordylus capensis]|uniref:coiled-coil domain-containing protein 91 isoform X2 n=1 Tax=Hemicordylus capensis TaxID=884348 RepID=UPI002302E7C7|nr:coiled-coil domain-containing protein 91 isoform X2 [Hemicordylus capensis]
MDDDEFGGFEAAEAFEGGNGEPQATSPAIPWAAFPTVSEVHIHQAVSTDVFQEQPSTSVCFVSSDPSNSSGDDILTDGQPSSSTLHLTDHKEQNPLSISPPLEVPLSSLSLSEDLETATNDDEKVGLNEPKRHLEQTLTSLEVKLKAADEEKCRIKKELEDLLNKYRMLETDFLKDKEEELISHQDRYNKLQEKHKLELEDMRRAGHEALTIIVEEFKALLQSTVQQREEAIEKQYVSAVEKQAYKCEEMLIAQHQRLLDMLDKERKMLEEKMEESMLERSQEFKEMLEKYMANERESNKEALAAAAKVEKENMQAAILTAVKAERENMEKLHAVEKEVWQAEQNKDREKVAQAIQDAIQEQRQNSQAIIQAAIMEEQKKSEKAIEEAVKQAREELMEYIKEQKRSSEESN